MRDNLIATAVGGLFTRPPSEFTGTVEPPNTAGAKHVAEAGRYHLFVSGVWDGLGLGVGLGVATTSSSAGSAHGDPSPEPG